MSGTYLPGAVNKDNERVRAYEESDGVRQNTLRGVPVIILTTRGRHSGGWRKVPLTARPGTRSGT